MTFPIKAINNVNWDFPKSETQYLTHKYHSYPARFIPQIPKTIYDICLKSSSLRIFDPFVGCGTSLVEGILSQNHAGGVDQNPLAILISQVKTYPIGTDSLIQIWDKFQALVNKKNLSNHKSQQISYKGKENSIRKQYPLRKFKFPKRIISERFTEKNVFFCSFILDYIENEISDIAIQNFFKVGLSSSITTLTDSRNWRKINLWNTFQSKINSMINIMKKFNQKVVEFNNKLQNEIKLGDSRNLSFLPDETIDCIVTSPPYVNALDYNRIHQYNMSILGYDYRKFAKAEIGAHGHHISNRWRLLTEYLADMFYSISEMGRVSKEGGVICIIIGDSCIEYEKILSHIHFKELGELLGLNYQISLTRNIDTTSKSTSKDIGNIFSEYLVFFTKGKEFREGTSTLIQEHIETKLLQYLNHVKTSKGTCLRNKPKLTKERQKLAVFRVEEALSKVKEDCRSI